jgi:hypothetical protein
MIVVVLMLGLLYMKEALLYTLRAGVLFSSRSPPALWWNCVGVLPRPCAAALIVLSRNDWYAV